MSVVRIGVLLALAVIGSFVQAEGSLIPLPAANFGGSGIPNSDVAVWTGSGLTLGLTAHTRCEGAICGEAVTNDGVSTFLTDPDAPFTNPDWAGWNFAFYANNSNASTTTPYYLEFAYSGTNLASTVFPRSSLGGGATLQGSENLGFAYLGNTLFDPTVPGFYTFTLRVYSGISDTSPIGSTSINVQVGEPVPEPATLTLLGIGLAGLGARRLRNRKRQ